MKKLFLLLALAGAPSFAVTAQTGTIALATPGFTNNLGPFVTNSTGTNVAGDLGPLLVNLQGSLSAVLPALVNFNNGFTIVQNGTGATGTNLNVGSGSTTASNSSGTVTAPSGVAGGTVGGNNLVTPNNSSTAPALGTSLGQDLATTVIAPPSNPALTTTTGANAANTTTSTTTTTNSAVLASIFGTNMFGFSNPQEALRALIQLQADVERMLPLVAALNGTSPTAVANSVATNGVGTGPATAAAIQSGTFNLNQTMLSFPTKRGVSPSPDLTPP